MRDIKFRANVRKASHSILRIIDMDFNNQMACLIIDEQRCEQKNYWFNEIDIMQYTGLKDKNGKEIYEGDILSFLVKSNRPSPYICEVKWLERMGSFEAVYNNKGHSLFLSDIIEQYNAPDDTLCHLPQEDRSFEIIGNIHENPELLK